MNTWIDDQNDDCLLEMMPLLKQIAIEKVPDVRVTLRKYRDSVVRYIQSNKALKVSNSKLIEASKKVA